MRSPSSPHSTPSPSSGMLREPHTLSVCLQLTASSVRFLLAQQQLKAGVGRLERQSQQTREQPSDLSLTTRWNRLVNIPS